MSASILLTIKKALGIAEDYVQFDQDIIMHINTALADLNQLGVGPSAGFQIEDSSETWDNFTGGSKFLNSVKSYLYLRVRQLFDPPATSYLVAMYDEQIKKLEWRMNVAAETELDEIIYDGGTSVDSLAIVYDGGTV